MYHQPLRHRPLAGLLVSLSLILVACGGVVSTPLPTPTPPPTPTPAAADRELLQAALANMPALSSFTWTETVSTTSQIGDYTLAPHQPDPDLPVDRFLGVADRTNQTYLVDIHLTAGITWTLVSQKQSQYWTDPTGISQEVAGDDTIYYRWPEMQQGMWETAGYLDYSAALARGASVTLGTPPTEVINGVPTVHLIVDLKAMPDLFMNWMTGSNTVEFWVTTTPPSRVIRQAHTVSNNITPYINSILFTSDSQSLLLDYGDEVVQIRRVADNHLTRMVAPAKGPREYGMWVWGFTPDGQSLIGCTQDAVYRWSAADGTIQERVAGYMVKGYLLSPDGRFLIGTDLLLRSIGNLRKPIPLEKLPESGYPYLLAFAANGKLVAAVSPPAGGVQWQSVRSMLQIWREDGTLLRSEMIPHPATSGIGNLLFTPDNQMIIIRDTSAGIIQIRQVADGKVLTTLAGPTGSSVEMALSPDGRWLAAGANDYGVRVWDLRAPANAPAQLDVPAKANFATLGFSPDGRTLAVSAGGIQLWTVGQFSQAPIYWLLTGTHTMKQVWTWDNFNAPVQISLPPTVTPEP